MKFGKRILTKPIQNAHEKKTGTKKLPVPGSRSGSDIGPTSGQGMDLLYWQKPKKQQTVRGEDYTIYR